jgi:hypothetical protein
MIVVIGLPLHAYRLGCSIGSTAMVHAGFAGGMGLAHPIFSRSLSLGLFHRHCEEPTGRANARPMTGSATKQSIVRRTRFWIASLTGRRFAPSRWLAMTVDDTGSELQNY